MNKLAVADLFSHVNYAVPILLELGPDYATYYCSSDTIKKHPQEVGRLLKAKISVVVDSYEGFKEHAFLLADAWHRARNATALWRELSAPPVRKIFYEHATDNLTFPMQGDILLYSSEAQMLHAMGEGLFMAGSEGHIDWGLSAAGGEGVIAGLLHLGEWADKRHKDKAQLRQELERHMGVTFEPSLPVVVYYTAEWLMQKTMDIGLGKLSNHANIVIKTLPLYPSEAKGKHVYFFEDSLYGSFLLRFAADVLLCGYSSGVLVTSLMLGLNAVSVYTPVMDAFARSGVALGPEDEKRFAGRERFHDYLYEFENRPVGLCKDIYGHLSPLNIKSVDDIVRRIYDRDYWEQDYPALLREMMLHVFGQCPVSDGPERAARYIKNALHYGTALLPEVASQNRRFAGRLSLA